MADTPVAPPLPDGSVDFNAIHDAAHQGHDLEKAIAAATFVHPDKAVGVVEYANGLTVDEIKPADAPAMATEPASAPTKSAKKEA
jgi:hypothetical protein